MSASLRIGTSGWTYDHWKGRFYPGEVTAAERLAYYATRFDTVEINNSFYGLPLPQTIRHWAATVPKGFRFAVKGSRFTTHNKKLLEPKRSTAKFFRVVEKLGDRLGPVLFQLPPHWRYNGERLAAFLQALPRDFRYAFEFREPSWWNAEAYDLLRAHRAALCIFDLNGVVSPQEITADFVYLRLHGPAQAYRGRYSAAALTKWAAAVAQWRAARKKVYVYFDNDEKAFAAAAALRLRALAGG